MAREKKKIDIKLIIGMLFLLVLLIGASYAYFVVGIESSEYNKTIVTGSTEGVSIASIQNPTEKLNLNVDAAAMSQNRLGTIYADDEENYVKTKSEGFHDIGIITLTNPKKDDNIYRCTASVTITVDNSANSILNFLQEGDLKIFLRWGTNHQVIDLSTLKEKNETTIPISLDIVGNNSKSIETYIELTNRDEDQSYLSEKDINIDIDTTDLKCELTGERAVYLKAYDWNRQFDEFRSAEYGPYIKNIYFVNYIDDNIKDKINWDLTRVGTGNLQSPAGSIIGWLEEIPKGTEDEENQFYNLYIGSKDNIYASGLDFFFSNMNSLETIDLSNFYTDLLAGMWRCFSASSNVTKFDVSKWYIEKTNFSESFGLRNLTELDVSNFNTKNSAILSHMFSGLSSVTKLDVSNFNTMKVTDMSSIFSGMRSVTELDVSGFYTGNVTTMSNMFRDTTLIKELDLSKFNTSNVTTMSFMFCGMSSLQNLDLSKFDTSQVTDMNAMFYNSTLLTRLDLSNFNTNKVVVTSSMFRDMKSLEYLDLRNAEFNQVTSYDLMFAGIKNGITIIVKDESNRDWIEARLKEAGKTGNVLLPSEIEEL